MVVRNRKTLCFLVILLPIILFMSLYHYLIVRSLVPYPGGEGGIERMQDPAFIAARIEFLIIHNSIFVLLLSGIISILFFKVPAAKSDDEKGMDRFLIFTGICLLFVPILGLFSFFLLCFGTLFSLVFSVNLIIKKRIDSSKALTTVSITAFSAFWSFLYFLHSFAVWGD
jgi:hypothetical protein